MYALLQKKKSKKKSIQNKGPFVSKSGTEQNRRLIENHNMSDRHRVACGLPLLNHRKRKHKTIPLNYIDNNQYEYVIQNDFYHSNPSIFNEESLHEINVGSDEGILALPLYYEPRYFFFNIFFYYKPINCDFEIFDKCVLNICQYLKN